MEEYFYSYFSIDYSSKPNIIIKIEHKEIKHYSCINLYKLEVKYLRCFLEVPVHEIKIRD